MIKTEDRSIPIQRCPYLGLHDDPSTSLAYPSAWNYCYHATPPASVLESHQVGACLTPGYINCAVYLNGRKDPLPASLRGNPGVGRWEHRSSKRRGALILFVFLAAFLILFVFLDFRSPSLQKNASPLLLTKISGIFPASDPPKQDGTVSPGASTGSVSSSFPEVLNSLPGEPGVTASQTINSTGNILTRRAGLSFTPAPALFLTPTPEGTCGHALDVPFGENVQVVLHRVVSGENLTLYAAQYRTDTAAILAVNHHLPMPVWEDWIIVIPVEMTDVTGLPAFEPYQAIGANLSLSELAQQLNTDAQSLSRYNAFGRQCKIFSGWLLIPRKPATP